MTKEDENSVIGFGLAIVLVIACGLFYAGGKKACREEYKEIQKGNKIEILTNRLDSLLMINAKSLTAGVTTKTE